MAGTNRTTSRQQSTKIAFCGLTAGLSVALMLAGGLIPVATYCVPMAGGILLLPILLEFGAKAALTTYAATALIALFLGADKEAAFFYLFLGYYPVLKPRIDRIANKALRFGAKLLVFNLSIGLMYALLTLVLRMDAIAAEFQAMGTALLIAFAAMMNVCLFLYDRMLVPMAILYVRRLRPKLRFLRR